MLATFWKCVALTDRRQRWQWAASIPLSVIAAILEAAGAAAVFALVKLIGDPTQVTHLPMLTRISAWLPGRDAKTLIVAGTCFVAVLYAIKNLTLALLARLSARAANQSWSALSLRLLRGYIRAPFVFHLRRHSSDLIHNTTEAADVVFRMVVAPVVAVISETLVVLAIVAVLLLTAPSVTVIAVGLLFSLLAILTRLLRRVLTRWGAREHRMRQGVLQTLQQTLEGVKEVKLRGREEFFLDMFGRQQTVLASVRQQFATLSSLSRLFVETTFITGILVVVLLVTLRDQGDTDIVPVLGLYAYAGFRIIPSVNRILMQIGNIRYGMPSVIELSDDLAACGGGDAERVTHDGGAIGFQHGLSIEGVSYTYDGAPRAVLDDITVTIRPGESIGLVGPTGAGKSTLINVVLGLLSPTRGRIRVDDIDIALVQGAWQRKIGYVPQAVFLMNDTLRRNIAFALPDDQIDDGRVWKAVRMAQLETMVAALPERLDAVVGERGVRLSGGERQRVAIARALYYEPELLIFDEATSALDSQTERELTHAIEALHGKKTLLIIAHRLSTVRGCDRLIFLRNGRVAGSGAFAELLASNAEFRSMAGGTDFVGTWPSAAPR